MNTTLNKDELWTEKQVATFLGVKPGMLANWRYERRELNFFKFSRAVRYDPREVRAYKRTHYVAAGDIS